MKPTDEMVERAAHGLACQANPGGPFCKRWDRHKTGWRAEEYREMARAALEAALADVVGCGRGQITSLSIGPYEMSMSVQIPVGELVRPGELGRHVHIYIRPVEGRG